MSDASLLLSGVTYEGDCWLRLVGARPGNASNGGGYSRVGRNGKTVYAHRLAYEVWVGPIPAGLQIDHLCRNRSCINPAHLEPVTTQENQRRGKAATKSACPRGHPYDIITSQGSRGCSICQKAADREHGFRRSKMPGVGKGGAGKAKTHCPKGHAYEGHNLIVRKSGSRACRACGLDAARRYQARKRDELAAQILAAG